jgi:hypothetical protein
VKAVACELPATRGVPLSRYSRTELHSLVMEQGITEASASTVWRWIHEDGLKPWQQRSWVFRATPSSPRRRRRCSTSIKADGRAGCFIPASS